MKKLKQRGTIKGMILTLSIFMMFIGAAMACDCESPPGHLTQISKGDSAPGFMINEPEHGILPPEYATVNPITFHQPDVDFGAFYAKHEVNGPCDLWPTTE